MFGLGNKTARVARNVALLSAATIGGTGVPEKKEFEPVTVAATRTQDPAKPPPAKTEVTNKLDMKQMFGPEGSVTRAVSDLATGMVAIDTRMQTVARVDQIEAVNNRGEKNEAYVRAVCSALQGVIVKDDGTVERNGESLSVLSAKWNETRASLFDSSLFKGAATTAEKESIPAQIEEVAKRIPLETLTSALAVLAAKPSALEMNSYYRNTGTLAATALDAINKDNSPDKLASRGAGVKVLLDIAKEMVTLDVEYQEKFKAALILDQRMVAQGGKLLSAREFAAVMKPLSRNPRMANGAFGPPDPDLLREAYQNAGWELRGGNNQPKANPAAAVRAGQERAAKNLKLIADVLGTK